MVWIAQNRETGPMSASPARSYVATLSFGGVLINTLPLWIGELGAHPAITDQIAGALGSLTLLLAAVGCGRSNSNVLVTWAWPALVVSILVLALTEGQSAILSAVACAMMGFFTGVSLSGVVKQQAEESNISGRVAAAISIGLLIALLCYLIVAITPLPISWVLVLLAGAMSVLTYPRPLQSHPLRPSAQWYQFGPILWLMPFFVMMGAYWTYLDLFAVNVLARRQVEIVLLCSLITGAMGSALAGTLRSTMHAFVFPMSLVLAAIAGAMTYFGQSSTVIIVGILLNGFFLFLFFPLYLSATSSPMTVRLAIYLAGFAVGGIIGAAITAIGGYPGLSIAIALSGAVGLIGVLRPATGQ